MSKGAISHARSDCHGKARARKGGPSLSQPLVLVVQSEMTGERLSGLSTRVSTQRTTVLKNINEISSNIY